ncbi:MAG: antitoxin [Gammaproteobacteria bacterium]
MRTAKVFKSGNSLAVRLPKDLQFSKDVHEVEIIKHGNELILREVPKNLARVFQLLTSLPNDLFESEREDSLPQKREFFE